VANPGDPTADPTKAWHADRRSVEVGTLVAQQVEAERTAPCRDINFDPTVLPSGMRTSDDPFPAARSAAYAKSYDLAHGGEPRTIPERRREPRHDRGSPALLPLQRLLHWLMAACIRPCCSSVVGMVSTVMPKYLTLVAIHKPLGIAILALALIRLAVRLRLWCAAAACRPPRADEARRGGVALRLVRPDGRHAAARLGHAVGAAYPSCCSAAGIFRDPAAEATACIRSFGTRISILLSRSSR
jgi:hypothetical protein